MALATRLTGRGTGAIAVIAVSGADAAAIVGHMTKGPLPAAGGVKHANLLHPASGEVLDDALVVRVAAETFELHVHGGVAVVEGVLKALESAGARESHAVAQTIESEVLHALPAAQTMTGAQLLASQPHEGLAAFVHDCLDRLNRGGELWKIQSAVQWVLQRSNRLRLLLQPARVAIVGAPNVGKSTLANALLGRTASITSDIAGTTRDWVESGCVFIGKHETGNTKHETAVPVTLVDTAGVRETADAIERIAIARTHEQARTADVVVVVLDGSRQTTPAETAMVQQYARGQIPCVVVLNKADLASDARSPTAAARISALRGEGLDPLMHIVLQKLDLLEVNPTEPFAFTPRLRNLLTTMALAEDPEKARAILANFL